MTTTIRKKNRKKMEKKKNEKKKGKERETCGRGSRDDNETSFFKYPSLVSFPPHPPLRGRVSILNKGPCPTLSRLDPTQLYIKLIYKIKLFFILLFLIYR